MNTDVDMSRDRAEGQRNYLYFLGRAVKDEGENFTPPLLIKDQNFFNARWISWVQKSSPDVSEIGEGRLIGPSASYISLRPLTPSGMLLWGEPSDFTDESAQTNIEAIVIRSVKDSFWEVNEVSHIFYSQYLEGLKFLILLSPETYDSALLARLYKIERQVRALLAQHGTVPFDIHYVFNAKAFDLDSLSEDMHLIHEK